MRIMLIEDNKTFGESVRDQFEADGHHVTWFISLYQARAAVPPIGFDLIVCDYDLPDGTGVEFFRSLERHEGLRVWTTVLWSGLDRSAEVRDSGVRNIDMVLVKTASLRDMLGVR